MHQLLWLGGCILAAALAGCGGGSSTPMRDAPIPTMAPESPTPVASATPEPSPTVVEPLTSWTSFGPEGGDVYALVLDPDRPDVLFAGTGRGVWRSLDGAQTWQDTGGPTDADAARGVVALVLAQPSLLFAATDRALYRSSDDGTTWHRVSGTIEDNEADSLVFSALASDGPSSGKLYASTQNHLYVSSDAGDSWAEIGQAPVFITGLAVDPSDAQHVFAGEVSAGAFSEDGGTSWTTFVMPAQLGFGAPPAYLSSFAFDAGTPGRAWVAAGHGGVFETTDSGRSWVARNGGIAEPSTVQPLVRTIGNAPHDPNLLLAGFSGSLYRSVDGARTWVASNSGLVPPDVSALAFDRSEPGVVFAGTVGGGVARSEDGGVTWRTASRGLNTSFVTAVVADPVDPTLIYAGTGTPSAGYGPVAPGPVGGLFRSIDGGRSWEKLRIGSPPGEVFDMEVDPTLPNTVFATVQEEGLLRSDDRGATWRLVGTPPLSSFLGRIAVRPGGSGIILLASGSLYRSIDGGQSWSKVQLRAELADGFKLCDDFSDVVIDPHDPERFYALSGAGVIVSTDSGEHWQGPAACSVFSLPRLRPQDAVLPDPTIPGRVYTSHRTVSEDGGHTFGPLEGNLPDLPIFALAHDGRHLYAALRSAGIFRSSDGVVWQAWNAGLASFNVNALTIDHGATPILAAATETDGVSLREIESIGAGESR